MMTTLNAEGPERGWATGGGVRRARRVPRATYRIQFHRHFTLKDGLELVPYLAELGISHVYASPLLRARSGSLHGYDVCDPTVVDPEIGTESDLERWVEALHARGMGVVLDIVPNHMAACARENRWWRDVLTHGRSSRYALFFDIDWEAPELEGRILVPVLGETLETVLNRGELSWERQGADGVVRYYQHEFPLAPGTFEGWGPGPEPAETGTDEAVLRALLARQHYRLSWWRNGDRKANYRRFFDIDDLIGVRVEDPWVFAETHWKVLEWCRRGWVDGLRIDHPDGLRDPAGYFRRLRAAAPEVWIVLEKILEREEVLDSAWPVDGTTGYEFLNDLTGLWMDPRGRSGLEAVYAEFTGDALPFAQRAVAGKRQALERMLRSDVSRLLRALGPARRVDGVLAGVEDEALREGMIELLTRLEVYRTYANPETLQMTEEDVGRVTSAMRAAIEARPGLRRVVEGIGNWLLGREVSASVRERRGFVLRFQQVSSPAMAKGVEDTAFYGDHRWVALNEVGGDPGRFGLELEVFHRRCRVRQREWPDSMLTTATHDTKRGEDVRARLAVLSEAPEEWGETVRRWSARLERYRSGALPDRGLEYLMYQTVVGAWPVDADRLVAYLLKAAREGKQHTSWTEPNAAYEEAMERFARGALADEAWVGEVRRQVARWGEAGWANSLGQLLIKLTAPGVPDVYQGTELWDLNLVDPDNRRAVDYALRQRLLGACEGMAATEAWARRGEGMAKLWLLRRVLKCRAMAGKDWGGGYEVLERRGEEADRVVSYGRGGRWVVVVPRWRLRGSGRFHDVEIEIPSGRWRGVLGGGVRDGGWTSVGEVLEGFPVALLEREIGTGNAA